MELIKLLIELLLSIRKSQFPPLLLSIIGQCHNDFVPIIVTQKLDKFEEEWWYTTTLNLKVYYNKTYQNREINVTFKRYLGKTQV